MSEKASALHSLYVIDGVQQELVPARLLETVADEDFVLVDAGTPVSAGSESLIVDETMDVVGKSVCSESLDPVSLLPVIACGMDKYPLSASGEYTRLMLASSLISTLWKKGHFGIGNLRIAARWSLGERKVGEMAAFYRSVEAAAEYADALGLRFASCECADGSRFSLEFAAELARNALSELELELPFTVADPCLESGLICPATAVADPKSWLVYVPFDTSDYRLGGSALAQAAGIAAAPPLLGDADYFLDCFEVVREFAEDGVLLSATTVGRGGLIKAVSSLLEASGCGADIDVSDILRSYGEDSELKLLCSEIPGALLQIRDSDFDYLDAELLLQDVAYFPLGHPLPGRGLKVKSSRKSGIETILESLMQNAEGED